MVPSNSVYEDRSAIKQALAILDQEGVHVEDDNGSYLVDSASDEFAFVLDDGLDLSYYDTLRSRSKSQSRTRGVKEVPSKSLKKSVNPRFPLKKKTKDDGSVSSSSVTEEVSDSSGSLLVENDEREVGGKAKRRTSTSKGRRNSQKQQTEKKDMRERKKGRSVRFSDFDHTVFIPHILDFTPEEIESCWMDEEDYRSIRSRSLTLIEMMEDEKKYPISADYMIVNKHLVCVRGLGEKTTQCTRELERVQRKLYKAVFRTQEELREEGVVDPEAIRQASKKYSKKSAKTARFVGISDEVNVSSKYG